MDFILQNEQRSNNPSETTTEIPNQEEKKNRTAHFTCDFSKKRCSAEEFATRRSQGNQARRSTTKFLSLFSWKNLMLWILPPSEK